MSTQEVKNPLVRTKPFSNQDWFDLLEVRKREMCRFSNTVTLEPLCWVDCLIGGESYRTGNSSGHIGKTHPDREVFDIQGVWFTLLANVGNPLDKQVDGKPIFYKTVWGIDRKGWRWSLAQIHYIEEKKTTGHPHNREYTNEIAVGATIDFISPLEICERINIHPRIMLQHLTQTVNRWLTRNEEMGRQLRQLKNEFEIDDGRIPFHWK